MKPLPSHLARGTVWGRNAPGPWEGTFQGYLVLVTPAPSTAALRDFLACDYADDPDHPVARAFLKRAERDLECSAPIEIHIRRVLAWDHPEWSGPASSDAGPVPSLPGSHFQALIEGGGPPYPAATDARLFTFLEACIRRHRYLNPWTAKPL